MIYMNPDSADAFFKQQALSDISALSAWYTDYVEDMSYMFYDVDALTNLSSIGGWDTSNVEDMSQMFAYSDNLTNLSAINGWNIDNVRAVKNDGTEANNKFYHMSLYTGGSLTGTEHPNFTMREGTWDEEGTFIPSTSTVINEDAIYVTVTFDEHVNSVEIGNSYYGTQTITLSGNNARIAKNTTYNISASFNEHWELGTWDYDENVSVVSHTSNPTTFVATDNAGLGIISSSVDIDINDLSSNQTPSSLQSVSSRSSTNSNTDGPSTKDSFSEPLGASTADYDDIDNTKTYGETTTEVSASSPVLAVITVAAVSTLAGVGAYTYLKKLEEKSDEEDEE
jgi:surface protein